VNLPIWRLEWTVTLRRGRLLAFNVGIPLLLALPLAFGGAPSYHAAAAYTVLFALFGTFGSTIPLLREADGGPLRRVVLTGFPASAFVFQRILAGTVLDLLQLSPAMALVLAAGGAAPAVWVSAVPAMFVALLGANVVGLWIAAFAGSIAEGALLAAVTSLFLLHGSGVFRDPAPDGVGGLLEQVLPYRSLHEVFLAAAGGAVPISAPSAFLVTGLASTLMFLGTIGVSRALLQAITDPIR
jgi:hypothetical protein